MSLSIEKYTKADDSIVQVMLTGSLDTATAADFDAFADAEIAQDSKLVVLNMKELDYISSAGIRSVFKLVKRVKAAGGRVAAANRQPQITKVFEIVQALPDLQIFKDDSEMDEYLLAVQDKIINGEDF